MSTVRRDIRSVPFRDAADTWSAVVDLITASSPNEDARKELMSVTGILASAITDQTPKSSPIVVTCDGARTRIYCLYDDDALDESSNEAKLGFDATKGNWQVSVAVDTDDLSWIQAALKKQTRRVVARDMDSGFVVDADKKSANVSTVMLDLEGFLKS
ncbi:hypothetical protein PHO31112_00008 [Pandoraea horticolens]|uniref:Uncharacterized protein n=1 Tax=Pandoraea horticolens TaxID=2508298 RepID=A0A5E4R6W9_9BURK|nr:hypothetical protein [Pandoraea horticolens]VVD59106.1 hypothetical protein PHO31112_00008 [Pandoraea horticolens]